MSMSVLVVEDQEELRTLIGELLRADGYVVRCVETVEEAMAALDAVSPPCLVLWDPVSLKMSADLLTFTTRQGVHVATIPIGVMPTGRAPDGTVSISKRLTSPRAMLDVVREHCSAPRDSAPDSAP